MARKQSRKKSKAGKKKQNPSVKKIHYRWSELPAELLEMIVKRVDLVSCIRFGIVCRSWLSVSRMKECRPSCELPWLMLSEKQGTGTRGFFSLSDGNVYNLQLPEVQGKRYFGSSEGWLIALYQGSKICALNPFTKEQIWLPRQPWGWRFFKAILSCSPTNSEAIIMAIVDRGDHRRATLAFCRPGDRTWTCCYHQEGLDLIEDVIFFKGQFHAINSFGEVIVCDVGSQPKASVHDFGDPPGLLDESMKVYLVESGGELLQAINYEYVCISNPNVRAGFNPSRTLEFQVFRLDLHESKWVRVESLGNRALFLGTSTSMSLSATEVPGCRGNCIYFTDDNYEGQQCNSKFGCFNSGIFHLAGRKVSSFFPTYDQSTLSPPIWITPKPW